MKRRQYATAGQRNTLVRLATVTSRTPDSDGGWTDNYTPLSPATEWAYVQPASANDIERQVGNTVSADVSHLVAIRYRTDVTVKTKIEFNGKVLYVQGVQDVDNRGVELRLACVQTVS